MYFTEWACLHCQHTFTVGLHTRVDSVKCPLCQSGEHLRANKVTPSPVTGIGANREADLGYRLLLEAQV